MMSIVSCIFIVLTLPSIELTSNLRSHPCLDFDTNYNRWKDNGINQVLPAAASVASLSSLGLIRDRMMKRQPKESEERKEMEERRQRTTRDALSAAAGLSTFAAISTTNLPSERGFGASRASSTISLNSASTQSPFHDDIRFRFNDGIANAATTEGYSFGGDDTYEGNANPWTEAYDYSTADTSNIPQLDESAVASTSSFIASSGEYQLGQASTAVDSSSFIIASEFSRGTSGIYDTKLYPKERAYSSIESGFSPPLKESGSRKGRSFMFGGISLRSLKSKFDSMVKEKPSEPEQTVEKAKQADKTAPVKSAKAEAVPKVEMNVLPGPPQPQTQIEPEISAVPEKIPLSKDNLSPAQPTIKPMAPSIPDKILLSPDGNIPKQQSPPKLKPEAEVILEKMEPLINTPLPSLPSTPPNIWDEEDSNPYNRQGSEFFDGVLRTIDTSRIKSPEGFYKGLAGGTLSALAAKGFQGGPKRRKQIIGSSPDAAGIQFGEPPQPPSSPNNIDTNQPYAFRSSSIETTSSQQSKFEIKTPTSYASSTTQAKSGEARVSVSIESSLESGSSVQFSASSTSQVASFTETPKAAPSYSANAIDTKATSTNVSYLDSLRTTSSTSGAGLQSYLGGLSGASPIDSTYNMGVSMDQFSSSLDSISQDLDTISNGDMDFESIDSVYKDLNSASKDISSVSDVLFAQESYTDGGVNTSPSTNHYGSYLDSILNDEASTCYGQGLTSYLDGLPVSNEVSRSGSSRGFTSYLTGLTSASSLTFDLPQDEITESIEVAPSFNEPQATDTSTSYQGSYLDSISRGSVTIQGQGLSSYLSELSTSTPLRFDIPEPNNYDSMDALEMPKMSVPPDSIEINSSNPASYNNPTSEITTYNGGRPRRVRVSVDSSVEVNRM